MFPVVPMAISALEWKSWAESGATVGGGAVEWKNALVHQRFFEVCAPCSDAHGDCCWAKTRAKIANKRKVSKAKKSVS